VAEKILNKLTLFEKWITFCAFMILVTVMFSDVALRELTGTGLHWSRQIGVYANLFVVMFGLGIASSEAAHLRPKFTDNWLPKHWDPFLENCREGLMFVFCFLFSIVAAQVVIETFNDNVQSIVLRIAIWPFQAIIPLAFFLTSIRHLIYAFYPTLRPVNDQIEESDPEET
jgi:TRAP-type C4-dicarboxylate transport system permease small subunit